MTTLFFIAAVGFFIWIIRNILFWTCLWQLKEYRFDRVFVHLKETQQGKSLLFSKDSNLKWTIIFAYILILINDIPPLPYQIIITIIFSFYAFLVFKEAYLRLFKRPVFTFKALAIIFLALLSIFFLFQIPLIDKFVWLILLDRFTPLVIGFFVFLFSFPTELYRDFKIEKAIKKIKAQKKLLVIGVTGSYGKSSTKEYIGQILEKNFKVIKTKGTNNTPIGIANTILADLKKGTQVFVVEMGAYKKSEIGEMCQITQPKIGVLTGVNYQHASLFGNLKNTLAAKYELIEALPSDGLALFNGNNENVYSLYKKTKKRKVLYESFLGKPSKTDAAIYAFNVKTYKEQIAFDVFLNRQKLHFEAPLVGIQNIENILPGIFIADYLGMSKAQIKEAVSMLLPLPKTMNLCKMQNGVVLVDDTFNANPDAVLAALQYMKIYKGKKILVLQPMIELGKNAKNEHYRIAFQISKVCNFLLLTNKNFYQEILKGIEDGGGKCIVLVDNPIKLSEFIKKNTGRGDVVVFEGKETDVVLSKIS